MTTQPQHSTDDVAPEDATLRSMHWGAFAVLGTMLMALGFAAIAFPHVATFAAEMLIGAVMVAGGIAQISQALSCRRWRGCALTALTGLLALVAGAMLLAFPLQGALTLTLVVAAYFLVSGSVRIALALTLRPHDSWGWVLLSGVMGLGLAGLVLSQLPEVVVWLLGLLLGVDLVLAGWWALLVARARRRIAG